MKTRVFLSALTMSVLCLPDCWAQNTRVEWHAFDAGFAVSTQANTSVKSAVGQVAVGISQQGGNVLESGFLANPWLRGLIVGVDDDKDVPTSYALSQNYPNPFNPTTTIEVDLPQQSRVSLKVYNVIGQEVGILLSDVYPAGYHRVRWDARNASGAQLASGVYFYRLEASATNGSFVFAMVRKMVVLK